MGREDWYRNTDWSLVTATEFWDRLNRARSSARIAQYLRIQAHHLEQANLCEPALELLDYLLTRYPERIELGAAQLCRASALAKLGRDSEAVSAFRAALDAQKQFPNVRTDAALDFAEFALLRERADLYEEVDNELRDYVAGESAQLFPVQRFKILAVGAIIERHRGNEEKSRELATRALHIAAEKHSGFQYHPELGLVGEKQVGLLEKLSELAAS